MLAHLTSETRERIEVSLITTPKNRGAPKMARQVLDGSGAAFEAGPMTFDPPQRLLPGGLIQTGLRWRSSFLGAIGGAPPSRMSIDGRVTGREEITVPAGTYNCFRVEQDPIVYESRDSDKPCLRSPSVSWIDPEVPVPIRTTVEITMPERSTSKHVTNLVRFVRPT